MLLIIARVRCICRKNFLKNTYYRKQKVQNFEQTEHLQGTSILWEFIWFYLKNINIGFEESNQFFTFHLISTDFLDLNFTWWKKERYKCVKVFFESGFYVPQFTIEPRSRVSNQKLLFPFKFGKLSTIEGGHLSKKQDLSLFSEICSAT